MTSVLSPEQFSINSDIEDFAEYLGFSGVDADMYYESYYQLNSDDMYEDEEYSREDEVSQTHWQY